MNLYPVDGVQRCCILMLDGPFDFRFECVSKLHWFISNMQIKTKLKAEIHGEICVNSL